MKSTEIILSALESPEALPQAAALKYITPHRWASRWSLCNNMIVALVGAADAATEWKWKGLGRKVIRDIPFYILRPVYVNVNRDKRDANGKKMPKRMVLTGFADHKVYAIGNTEIVDEKKWLAFNPDHALATNFIEDMTVRYAHTLDRLNLDSLTADGGMSYFLRPILDRGASINMAHADEHVFVHELAHAVDQHLGSLTEAPGQQPDNEVVAEFVASTVMYTQNKHPVDIGTSDYIRGYVSRLDGNLATAISKLMHRIECVVTFILEGDHA